MKKLMTVKPNCSECNDLGIIPAYGGFIDCDCREIPETITQDRTNSH